jgi:hypothetical protein
MKSIYCLALVISLDLIGTISKTQSLEGIQDMAAEQTTALDLVADKPTVLDLTAEQHLQSILNGEIPAMLTCIAGYTPRPGS